MWKPRPLGMFGIMMDGLFWQPAIFDYSEWAGEEYEKKRGAMLEYTEDDRLHGY